MSPTMRPRGTRDWRGVELHAQRHVEAVAERVFRSFGCEPVRPPSFEAYHLLESRYGEAIRERLFTFYADREYALRPDLTGPVARMVVEGELAGRPLPHKLSYAGSCFRYERSQDLRYREFRQAGVEICGAPAPLADPELLECALTVLDELGIEGAVLRLGHAGLLAGFLDALPSVRPHKARLVRDLDALHRVVVRAADADPAYLAAKRSDLAARQRALLRFGEAVLPAEARIDAAPQGESLGAADLEELAGVLPEVAEATYRAAWATELGLLGEVVDRVMALVAADAGVDAIAGVLGETLSEEAVHSSLSELGRLTEALPARWSDRAVLCPGASRGLAYYTGMTFEIELPAFGGQKQLCGGGRFDRLIAELGGPDLPAAGFAFGVERLAAAMRATASAPAAPRPIYVAAVDDAVRGAASEVARELRAAGHTVHKDLIGIGFREQLGQADALASWAVVVVGPEELERRAVAIRWLDSRKQEEVPRARVIEVLAASVDGGTP